MSERNKEGERKTKRGGDRKQRKEKLVLKETENRGDEFRKKDKHDG